MMQKKVTAGKGMLPWMSRKAHVRLTFLRF
jgi:hypothetical protein